MLQSDLSLSFPFNFGCELELSRTSYHNIGAPEGVCLIALPCELCHVGSCLMVLERRDSVQETSWCPTQTQCMSTCLLANSKGYSDSLKPLRVLMVRMLGHLPHGTQVQGNSGLRSSWHGGLSTWTVSSSLLLLLFGRLHSFPFINVQNSPVQIAKCVTRNSHFNYWRHTDLFLSPLVSEFPGKELTDPISGLASCDQRWDVEKNSEGFNLAKGSIMTSQQWLEDGSCFTNGCSYTKACMASSPLKQHDSRCAARPSYLFG